MTDRDESSYRLVMKWEMVRQPYPHTCSDTYILIITG